MFLFLFSFTKKSHIQIEKKSDKCLSLFCGTVNSFIILSITGTCHILNGGCEDICIPVTNGRRCECDIGIQLQTDNTCDSGR